MKFIKISAIVLAFLANMACKSAHTVQISPEQQIQKYSNTITAAELKKHLDFIASNEMEGRQTGSEGQKKAGVYMVNQYKSDKIPYPTGASNYFQSIPASSLNKRNAAIQDSENIWAFIEGSEKPDEIIIISAHYDHIGTKDGKIFNGADDDASGTVALMEMAQAFAIAKKDGHGPKRSILFLHMTGEEHGLLGSKYYVEHPLFPLANTVADINIDMIGRRDLLHPDTNNYIYVIGANRLSTELDEVVTKMNQNYVNLDLDYRFNAADEPNRYYFRSDHYNFAKNGIPSVFFFNGVHEDYHKHTDTPEKIEFDALQKRAQLAFVIAWELANRDQRITVDKDGK